jgi:DNA-directed RNA polymerase specialized sigma24 family protein
MSIVQDVAQEAATLCRRLQASIGHIELRKQASEVRRRIWASQSAFERLAAVWLVLARESYDHYGQALAAVFLLAGVHGMPPVHGKDTAAFMSEFSEKFGKKGWHEQVNQLIKMLPGGYGRQISDGMHKEALALAKNPAKADNIVSKVFETIWKGGGSHIKGEPFASAIKYIKVAIKNTFLNEQKSQKHHVTIDDSENGGPELISPHDDDANFAEKVLKDIHEDPGLRKELEGISKARGDAVKFLQLLAQGYDAKEIIGDYRTGAPSMLPHIDQSSRSTGMTPENWQAFIKPTIYQVVKRYYER